MMPKDLKVLSGEKEALKKSLIGDNNHKNKYRDKKGLIWTSQWKEPLHKMEPSPLVMIAHMLRVWWSNVNSVLTFNHHLWWFGTILYKGSITAYGFILSHSKKQSFMIPPVWDIHMLPDFFTLICSNVCHLNQNFKGTELVFFLCSLPTTALHAPPQTFHGCANENENCQTPTLTL